MAQPLETLQEVLFKFFDKGPKEASYRFINLRDTVLAGKTSVATPRCSFFRVVSWFIISRILPWNSCKLASTLVLVLASRKDAMQKSLQFNSRSLGGQITIADIQRTPSASLSTAFRVAKKNAQTRRKTTVLGVILVDVEMIERAETGRSVDYMSYAHSFVVGISPEGVIIWQSWGKHGYRLDEYLLRGGARMRSWAEADDFIQTFERIRSYEGPWSMKMNEWYKKCFEIDIETICGVGGPSGDIVPKCKSWVKLHKLEDVKVEDVEKFIWV